MDTEIESINKGHKILYHFVYTGYVIYLQGSSGLCSTLDVCIRLYLLRLLSVSFIPLITSYSFFSSVSLFYTIQHKNGTHKHI